MSLYNDLIKRMAVWYQEHRVNAIRSGTGLKSWSDTEDEFNEVSPNEGAQKTFDTKEEFEAITKKAPDQVASDVAVPGARAAFLSSTRKGVCQSCSCRIAKYERAAKSSWVSGNNLKGASLVHDRVKGGTQ